MNKFKIGDKVKIVDSQDCYFNCEAIIKETDCSIIPYFCNIKSSDGIKKSWYREEDLILIKDIEKHFTISIRKHKRLNLNFKL